VKAIIIGTNGSVTDTEGAFTLDELQTLVGGWIEAVGLGGGAHGYINEEGKYNPETCPPNKIATRLCHGQEAIGERDWIAGPMVILGETPDGGEADVPDWVRPRLEQIIHPSNRPDAGLPFPTTPRQIARFEGGPNGLRDMDRDEIEVSITSVWPAGPMSTIWYGEGIRRDNGKSIRFGGDWRPMREIAEALEAHGGVVIASVPKWALLSGWLLTEGTPGGVPPKGWGEA
jgi:hypothetical protein